MGIDNIHILTDPDSSDQDHQVRRKEQDAGSDQLMSQHIVVQEAKKFMFGWDQPLMSFYLQVHDSTRSEDEQIVVWLGATADTRMYEVEDLVRAAHKHGLHIDHEMRVKLYGEKDDGR